MFTFTDSKASMSGTGSTSTLSISSIFVRRSANMVPRSIKSIKSIKNTLNIFENRGEKRSKTSLRSSSELEIRWKSAGHRLGERPMKRPLRFVTLASKLCPGFTQPL